MPLAESILVALLAMTGAAIFAAHAWGTRAARWFVPAMALLTFGGAWWAARRRDDATVRPSSVASAVDGEYVSSDACLPCHPGEHASWHRSFHRTMTQRASADSVRAPLGSGPLSARPPASLGLAEDPTVREEKRVWATVNERGVDVARPVALTTGSHRQQAYWYESGDRGELRLLPFVYLLDEQRFLPRRDAFLQPPEAPERPVRWNSNCIQCHAVAGEPRHDEATDRFSTRAVELGIACEACHGPGGEHVRRHRDPIARYTARAAGKADPSIVHPGRLPADRAAAICGQCHAYAYPNDEEDWWTHGYRESFRPGDALEPSRTLLTRAATHGPSVDAPLDSIFWSDGTVRVGGREYSGMVLSRCYLDGRGDRQLSCGACHAMHDGDPDGQLRRDRPGDAACLACHPSVGPRLAAHTRHAEDSPGSRCVACHMPKTSYALLRAVRSHRVDSPRVPDDGLEGRLPACNLCHVDRSLAWTRAELARRATPPSETTDPSSSLGADEPPAALAWILAGDAARRALAADALASPESRAAAGVGWQPRFLRPLLDDPYAAVRLVAARALRSLPAEDAAARGPDRDDARLRALRDRRDDRPITISE